GRTAPRRRGCSAGGPGAAPAGARPATLPPSPPVTVPLAPPMMPALTSHFVVRRPPTRWFPGSFRHSTPFAPLKRTALGSGPVEAGSCPGRHWAKTSPAHGAESSPPAGASLEFALVGESQVTLGSRSWECARRNRGPAVSVSYAGRRKAACPPRRRRAGALPERRTAAEEEAGRREGNVMRRGG